MTTHTRSRLCRISRGMDGCRAKRKAPRRGVRCKLPPEGGKQQSVGQTRQQEEDEQWGQKEQHGHCS
jgi:hypothetical protein